MEPRTLTILSLFQVGTTAEIFEYNDSEERSGDAEADEFSLSTGLKIKARGRQRFRLQSTRRQVDGNLVGEVKLLTDRELGEPDEDIRVPSLERFPRPDESELLSPEEEDSSSKQSCFSFLSLLRKSSSSASLVTQSSSLKSPRRRTLR